MGHPVPGDPRHHQLKPAAGHKRHVWGVTKMNCVTPRFSCLLGQDEMQVAKLMPQIPLLQSLLLSQGQVEPSG